MPRPATFEEYLASLVPPSVRGIDRRTMLAGGIGLGALTLAGCGDSGGSGSSSTSSGGASSSSAATGTVTLGSNQSDAVPKAAIQSVMDAFKAAARTDEFAATGRDAAEMGIPFHVHFAEVE